MKKNKGCIDCHTDLMLLSPLAKRCHKCSQKARVVRSRKGYHIRKYRKYVKNISKDINIEWEV